MANKKTKICILVSNDLTRDPRVTRQAEISGKYGFETVVLGWNSFEKQSMQVETEHRRDFKVVRGRFNPFLAIFKPPFNINIILALYNILIIFNKIFSYAIRLLDNTGVKILFFKPKSVSLMSYCKSMLIKIWSNIIEILSILKTKLIILKTKLINVLIEIKFSTFRIIGLNPHLAILRADRRKNKNNPIIYSQVNIPKTPKILPKNQPGLYRMLVKSLSEIKESFFYLINYYKSMWGFMINEGIRFKPDIVHANDLDTLWAGWQIKKKTGAKLIYDAHEVWTEQGLELPKLLLWLFKILERYLLSKIDAFVSVNQSIIEEIEQMYNHKFGVPNIVIYNCPNYQKVKLKRKFGQKIRIIYQGRYSPGRGLEELALSARWLDDGGRIYFRGLGDMQTKMKLEKIVEKFNLSSKVKFLDPVPMEQLITTATNTDIGVISYIPLNINNKLCTPNKLFEYIMAGLALAVSDLPELRLFIKKYHNGLLFNPHNPKSIAKALNKLISNKKGLLEMKKNSLLAAKELNWQKESKKLLNLYKDLGDPKID